MKQFQYAELRCRTHYSFLRGASHPHELVDRAAEIGLSAIAITDRDGVYGIPKAYEASKKYLGKYPELKLIVGAELTLENLPRLTLLAIDRKGYGLLCRLLTASHEGRPKGGAALTWHRFLELTQKYDSKGLIALADTELGYGATSSLTQYYETLVEIFGAGGKQDGRFYITLTQVLDGLDRRRVQSTVKLSQHLGVGVVATNDVHFHVPERRVLQDVLTSIKELTPLDQVGRRLFSNGERYLKSPQEMARLFKDFPKNIEDPITNTLRIAERCNFSPKELRYYYPSEWIPASETAQSYLEKLTWEGAKRRYSCDTLAGIPADVVRQLKHELKLIQELSFADYFLTIWEIVEFAKQRKILCQGRGSAANSAVCYCLGITAIDPVRMNLLFERFISAERGEPPDIDVDFEHERREEVIQHIYEKYGRDRAGMVSAVITYRSRSIVRDVSKALNLSGEVSRDDPRLKPYLEELRGFPRHLSIHSGGFTLSAEPIIETVPIEPARMEGRTIVQWDKEDLATIGLLKVDILALGMLSALAKTFELIKTSGKSTNLSISTIPAEDPTTYAMIQRADTVGVFQIESRAQMNMLRRLKPKNFYDLVIEVAIVRPGPIVGKMVHPFLRRRRGLESSASPDPRLEPILGRTLGVPLFQEQVMKMAILMAGFTPGEADQLRRAIGAWRSSGSIEKMGKKLMEGLLASGLPKEFVERVFLQIQGFAEYGFPESHAASFALLAYASSYLRCHYPAEFTCALLNSQPMGFYSSHTLVEDARRHGVRVLSVHPNFSDWDCTIEDGALRIGWRVVNGLAKSDALRIVDERVKHPFCSLVDFLSRVRLSQRALTTLAMGEVFSCFGLNQRQSLWQILAYWSANLSSPSDSPFNSYDGQLDLFQGVESREQEAAAFSDLSELQAIQSDHSAFGLSVRGHPMQALRKVSHLSATTNGVKRLPPGRMTRLAGLVIARQRPQTAKGTVFATLEDEEGFCDLILHERVFEKFREIFVNSPFVSVTGKVQTDGEAMNIIVQKVESLGHFFGEEMRIESHDFR